MDVSQNWSLVNQKNPILASQTGILIHSNGINADFNPYLTAFHTGILSALLWLNSSAWIIQKFAQRRRPGHPVSCSKAAASHRGAPCSLVSHTFGLVSTKEGERGDKWIKAEEINSAGEIDGNHSNYTWNWACWVSLPPAFPQPSEHGGQRPWGSIKQELMVFHCDTDGECVPEVCLLIVFRPCKSTIILPPQSENTQE